MTENFRIVFVERPGVNGEPQGKHFNYESCPYPSENLSEGDVLLKTLYLSVDPALRCCMNENTGVDYLAPWQPGGTPAGMGLGVVVKSSSSEYSPGQVVTGGTLAWPWMLYCVLPAKENQLIVVDEKLVGNRLSLMLSCFGLVGLTALLGIRVKGHIDPAANQTVVVSGAAGACGSLAGQIAKLDGAINVVGLCGSAQKCSVLTDELGFAKAINYKTNNIANQLKESCPDGIDVYFDNVGGEISDEIIRQMNQNGHIILCGQISQYNKDVPYPPPLNDEIQEIISKKKITRDRFLVLSYPEKFTEGIKQLAEWVHTGKLKVKETIVDGLENTGNAFVSMMKGGNIGKQLVHVADV